MTKKQNLGREVCKTSILNLIIFTKEKIGVKSSGRAKAKLHKRC